MKKQVKYWENHIEIEGDYSALCRPDFVNHACTLPHRTLQMVADHCGQSNKILLFASYNEHCKPLKDAVPKSANISTIAARSGLAPRVTYGTPRLSAGSSLSKGISRKLNFHEGVGRPTITGLENGI